MSFQGMMGLVYRGIRLGCGRALLPELGKVIGRMRLGFFILLLLCVLPALPCYASSFVNPKSSIQQISGTGKYFMHLEGTPYEIGYAMGYFRPNDVVRLVHGEYVINVLNIVMPSFNIGYVSTTAAGLDLLLRTPGMQAALDLLARDVPHEYKQEMRGIADGTNAALSRYAIKAVTYYHVLLVNLLPSLQYLTTSSLLASLMNRDFEACQGFVAFDHATYDGSTFMGRHFMWTPDPLHEITCLAEYVPRNGYRFVAVTCPGMVGVITGMNTSGIGCGQDFFRAVDKAGWPSGVGMWLLGRKIVQYSGSVPEAEAAIRASNEGAPAFILVGDAKGAGAVFEVYDHRVSPRYTDWVSPDPSAPDAIETADDVVIVSNNAFTPDMHPIDNDNPDSLVRYEMLTQLVMGAYGAMDQGTGRLIIDFMHPPSPYRIGDGRDYADDPTQPVQQHVVFMDLTRRTLWALFGHYNDPWVTFTLK